jgi:hypothetical protein
MKAIDIIHKFLTNNFTIVIGSFVLFFLFK